MVLDNSLLNTQHSKVRIKGKVEQSRERSSALPYTSVCYVSLWPNKRQHNKDRRHSSLEKYTSHFIERVVCERELETEQNCKLLTPTLLTITTFRSRSSGLLHPGPGGPTSLGAGFLYRILSPTRLMPNCLTSSLYPGYIIVLRPLNLFP